MHSTTLLPKGPRGMWKLVLIACSVVLAVQMLTGTGTPQTAPERRLAPVLDQGVKTAIPGAYIVVFRPSTSRAAVQVAQTIVKDSGGIVGQIYTSALIGFSATDVSSQALEKLQSVPGVAYIEADKMGSIQTIQPGLWGLARTSKRLLPLPDGYSYSETGDGVHVYVIDTGIYASHQEFGNRVSGGVSKVIAAPNNTSDSHGHGTHVSGTIGGATYGIATSVSLHPVRVSQNLNMIASIVAAGVDWITANRSSPAVVNMSLAFVPWPSLMLDDAVRRSIKSGVTYVVAAGNNNGDACSASPARVSKPIIPPTNLPTTCVSDDTCRYTAITVGASAINLLMDKRWVVSTYVGSNFGSCLNLFAPGVNILSASWTDPKATRTDSGTSMATAHVTGVAALYLQNHPMASPADVWTAIQRANNKYMTTVGWPGVFSPGPSSPNELLHWGPSNDGCEDCPP